MPQTPPAASACTSSGDAIAVVLDTNVVLDWLVFRDPACHALAEMLGQGRLRWIAAAAMRNELAAVLSRPQLLQRHPDANGVLAAFDAHAWLVEADAAEPASAGPRCRDPADQKFIDLACAVGARWLFTRDRALLDLSKAARAQGVDVLTPLHWSLRAGGLREAERAV